MLWPGVSDQQIKKPPKIKQFLPQQFLSPGLTTLYSKKKKSGRSLNSFCSCFSPYQFPSASSCRRRSVATRCWPGADPSSSSHPKKRRRRRRRAYWDSCEEGGGGEGKLGWRWRSVLPTGIIYSLKKTPQIWHVKIPLGTHKKNIKFIQCHEESLACKKFCAKRTKPWFCWHVLQGRFGVHVPGLRAGNPGGAERETGQQRAIQKVRWWRLLPPPPPLHCY